MCVAFACQVCVVIVSDGIKKINNDTLRRADELGIAKQAMIFHAEDLGMVEPDDIELHEFTAAPCLEPATRAWKKKYGARYCPMQVVFAIKEHNGGKLDSHKWFFDAYCRRANPEFVVVRYTSGAALSRLCLCSRLVNLRLLRHPSTACGCGHSPQLSCHLQPCRHHAQ